MKPYIQKLIDMIPPENRGFMLDLGCGNGEDLEVFDKAGFNTFGIDISEDAVSNSRRDIRTYDIIENKYSLIVCNNVLPFIKSKNDVEDIIIKMAKGLKENGVMYFTVFGPKDEWFGKEGMSFYGETELDNFLKKLHIKFYEKNIRVGYGKTMKGKTKFWHVLSYTYTKIPI